MSASAIVILRDTQGFFLGYRNEDGKEVAVSGHFCDVEDAHNALLHAA